MEAKSGTLLDQQMLNKKMNTAGEVLNMLSRYISRSGRPASINVRDERTARYIEDFCGKLGIKMISGKSMRASDAMMGNLMQYML
jgi:type IV secretory pathway TraG/TraD family ATPase VirD4